MLVTVQLLPIHIQQFKTARSFSATMKGFLPILHILWLDTAIKSKRLRF